MCHVHRLRALSAISDKDLKIDRLFLAAGIAFLRGFQVTLQALGGSQIVCQLFLLRNNLTLTPAHAQRVRSLS